MAKPVAYDALITSITYIESTFGSCKSETLSTLRFAQRAKAIKNKATVNEEMQEDVNVLRKVIRQLRDELHRMKANQDQTGQTGAYTTGWSARRSLNLLKFSLNRPMMLPHVEDDSDEEMEIVDTHETMPVREETCVLSPGRGSDDADVNMEDEAFGTLNKDKSTVLSHAIAGRRSQEISPKRQSEAPPERGLGRLPENGEHTLLDFEKLHAIDLSEKATASDVGIMPIDTPVLKSPTPSVSPRLTSSRKSLRSPSTITASQSKLNAANSSMAKHPNNSIIVNPQSTRKSCFASTEQLAATLHQGLEMIQSQRLTPAMRRSSFRFSCMPGDFKTVIPVGKVDVGVQTLSHHEKSIDKDTGEFLCCKCKGTNHEPDAANNSDQNMQLVPSNESPLHGACNTLVPKVCRWSLLHLFHPYISQFSRMLFLFNLIIFQAVEKVLAGAIRREMALEEISAKQTSEIMQLNRLVCLSRDWKILLELQHKLMLFFLLYYRSSNINTRESAMPYSVKLVKIKLLDSRA